MYLKKELYELIKTDESIFDFIQESSLDGLWYWDLENPENEWMNARFWTVLGYNPDEMPHKSTAWQNIINQDDLKLASDNFTKHCENPNHPYDQVVRYTHKNGSTVWIRCRGMVIRDNSGKPTRMLGAHQDVTELKRSEQELVKASEKVLESEEKYRAFYNNTPLSYQSLDENGCFIAINPMWSKTLGYEKEEVIGKWYGDFLHSDYVEHFRINFPAFKKRGYVSDVQFKLRRKDNTYIYVSFEGCVGYTPEGKFRQTYCVFKDITEQKALENAIKKAKQKAEESEENLSITLHSIGDGVISTDKFGIIDRMNPVALKLCGWHEDEIKGKPLTEVFKIINFYTREPVSNPVEKVIANGEIVGLANHTVLVAKDGKEYQIADSAAPIKDKDGNIKGIVLVFSDVSEKYAAEEAIKRKSENLAKLLRASSILNESIDKKTVLQKIIDTAVELTQMDSGAIYMVEGNYLYMSAAQPVFPATYPDEFRRAKLDDHFHINRTVLTKEIVILQDVLKEKLTEQEEVIVKARGFRTLLYLPLIHENAVLGVLILGTISRLHQFSDEELSLCSTFSNLSSTALANAKLFDENMQSVEKLKLLNRAVEASSVSVVITNAEGNIQYVNRWFTEITGYSSDEVLGKNPRVLKSGNHPKIFYEDLWNTILSGKDWTGELLNRKKNGELYWEKAIISPIISSNGVVTSFVAIKEDITEQKKMLEELIAAKEKAEESDRLKSAFLANMSHEIRTPMNGILGFAELLKDHDLNGETQQHYIRIIEKSGARMLNIINDIVSLSKIESGIMDIHLSEMNINTQLQFVYDVLKLDADNKKLNLSFNCGFTEKEANIKTDGGKFYGLLSNLVKNAIKYTDSGTIEYGCSAKGKELEFYVRDTGIGIPKDWQEAIFERFIQADITDKMARQGAGLGLTISRAYVEMLGGKIWVESEEGKGSTFYFTLPYNAESVTETIARQLESSGQNDDIRKLKILMAEDDEVSEMLLTETVIMFGKEILKARTGVEAVEACKNNPDIDLVLMDILMPEMGGYEATKQIREFNKAVIIIAQTAYGLMGDREKSLESGCNDYIAKPINKTELQAMIQKYFGK